MQCRKYLGKQSQVMVDLSPTEMETSLFIICLSPDIEVQEMKGWMFSRDYGCRLCCFLVSLCVCLCVFPRHTLWWTERWATAKAARSSSVCCWCRYRSNISWKRSRQMSMSAPRIQVSEHYMRHSNLSELISLIVVLVNSRLCGRFSKYQHIAVASAGY